MLKNFILFGAFLLIASGSAATICAQEKPVDGEGAWKTAATEKAARGDNFNDDFGLLKKVRVGKHEGFDRIVFEFGGPPLTSYRIRYATPPFPLGESDENAEVAGKSFLEVFFTPCAAHSYVDDEIFTEGKQTPNFPTLTEAFQVYDHEGQVIYILGLTSKKEYRVEELENPTRLVIDIKH